MFWIRKEDFLRLFLSFFSVFWWKSALSKLRCWVLFWKRQVLINITPNAQTLNICCQRTQPIHNPAPLPLSAAAYTRHPARTHIKQKECLSIIKQSWLVLLIRAHQSQAGVLCPREVSFKCLVKILEEVGDGGFICFCWNLSLYPIQLLQGQASLWSPCVHDESDCRVITRTRC